MLKVYIDGSSKGNPGPGGAGIVIKDATTDEIMGIHGIGLGVVTNNQAEFLALRHALTELKQQGLSYSPINVLTDSTLVVGVFSQNWRAKANRDLVLEIKEMLKEFPALSFTYVRGHSGIKDNEEADALAQEAADFQEPVCYRPGFLRRTL